MPKTISFGVNKKRVPYPIHPMFEDLAHHFPNIPKHGGVYPIFQTNHYIGLFYEDIRVDHHKTDDFAHVCK